MWTASKAPAPQLLTGDEVMALLGLGPGPAVGRALDALQEEIESGEVTDAEEARAFLLDWWERDRRPTAAAGERRPPGRARRRGGRCLSCPRSRPSAAVCDVPAGPGWASVVVNDATVCDQSEAELRGALAGRRVVALRRRGKYLLVDLEGESATPPPPARRPSAHDRPAALPPGARRAAGRASSCASSRLRSCSSTTCAASAACGPSCRRPRTSSSPAPWAPSPSAPSSRRVPAPRAAGRRAPLKSFLLDQRRIAGVGNIYADEALFRARLHPLRPAGSVGPREAQRLRDALLETLQLGIDHEGSSIESFVDPAGERGSFQEILNVYGRTGEPCRSAARPSSGSISAAAAPTSVRTASRAAAACAGSRRRRGEVVPPRWQAAGGRRQTASGRAPAAAVCRGALMPVVAGRAVHRPDPRAAPDDRPVGSLGLSTFERGWYAYVGSAARARRGARRAPPRPRKAAALARRLPLLCLPGAPRLACRRRRRRV